MAEHISNLKVITVMEPLMCLTCKSAHIADVLFSDGGDQEDVLLFATGLR